MPAFLIEMTGDGDKEIMDFAVERAARGHWICQVTLEPGDGRDMTSVADYALGQYRYNSTLLRDEVTLTLVDGDGKPVVHPNGMADIQTVAVRDISELKIY